MSKALATKNVAAALLAVTLVFSFAFSFAAPAKADTLSDLQSQVQALLAQISSLQGGQGGSQQMGGLSCTTFTQNLKQGSTGSEVMALQKFLNSVDGTQVSTAGAGSPGNETSTFGPATKAAVIRFQDKFASEILTPVGLTKGTGNWFASSRAKANALCAGGGSTGGTTGGPVIPSAGGSLMVAGGTQPSNSLAPSGASRVPFTTLTLTNTSNAAVTVTGVTVQRTGLANDAIFSGVVLVDSNGLQVGVSRTFDSNHMATIGDTMTINPGQSVTLTVAGNMTTTNASTYSGQVASIAITGVNVSSGTVSGSLPITGAMQTFNSTLSIGTVTTGVSSFDPNAYQTKHIGDTGLKFSAVRFTAGSAEDIKLYSIRWRLNGSVSPSDIANVMTNVNGTTYPTTVSADGRYFTSTFPGGIMMQKGFSVDAYVQGDLVGGNASGRTVQFDLDKLSDVYFVGQTYGYGVMPTLNGGCSALLTGNHATCLSTAAAALQPWLQGSLISVQGGTVTTIQKATSVASQNISVNVPNQVLGGFQTNFLGEAVTIQGMTVTVASSSITAGSIPLTSVSIVDENGAIVAGPVDMVAHGTTLVFTNSITFPVGSKTYTFKGKLASGFSNGDTVTLTVTPTNWTSPQGQVTGNSVSITTTAFALNAMTVRGATLAVAASANPSSQSVVKGGQNIVLANIQLDASQSGEDLRLSGIQLDADDFSGTSGLASLTSCQLWNGATSITTGSNVKNTITDAATNQFTFDNALTLTKGTVVTLALSCNLSSSATANDQFRIGISATPTVTGVQSGNTVSNIVVNNGGGAAYSGTMTVSNGASVVVSVDSSSPSYQVVAGGTTGVTLGVIKLRGTNEDFNLNKIGLSASSTVTANNNQYGTKSTGSGGSASASGDLVTVYLYNSGGTLLGTATFLSGGSVATSTFNTPLVVTRDTDTMITVKADLANIGVSSSGGIANLITVDPLNFEGTGVSSGNTIRGGASGNVSGVRMFKSFPTVALDTLPSTGVADGKLIRFKVTANSKGSIGISNFNFTISSTTGSASLINLYGFTDSSYSQAISGQGTGGLIGSQIAGVVSGTGFDIAPTTAPVQVPAGSTYYFQLQASVSAPSNTSIVTTLNGDAAYGTTLTSGYNAQTSAQAVTSDNKNFVWSGNSTSTSALLDIDFSDGYSVPGLPSSGLSQTRSN